MRQLMIALLGLLALPAAALAGPNYNLNWYVVDGGGDHAVASTSFKLGVSAAQTAAGEVASPSFRMKMGFWYGARICYCPHQGDINTDGFINVQDVVLVINRTFKGAAAVKDPSCPRERADFNANGGINVQDVMGEINRVFKSGPLPVNPCGP